MFTLVEPEGMYLAVIRGKKNLFFTISVQIHWYRVRLAVLYDAIVFTQRGSGVDGCLFPVPDSFAKAATIFVKEKNRGVFAGRMAH